MVTHEVVDTKGEEEIVAEEVGETREGESKGVNSESTGGRGEEAKFRDSHTSTGFSCTEPLVQSTRGLLQASHDMPSTTG